MKLLLFLLLACSSIRAQVLTREPSRLLPLPVPRLPFHRLPFASRYRRFARNLLTYAQQQRNILADAGVPG